MTKDRNKFRAKFKKGHATRARDADLTRQVQSGDEAVDDVAQNERVTGKGALTRHRTIVGQIDVHEASGVSAQRDVDTDFCLRGRVLRVHGLSSVVRVDDGRELRCAVRGVLKSMATDQRHVLAAGDLVWIRPEPNGEGFIERIEPRAGSISRNSRGKRHVIVANVDQLLIVASAAEPRLKPNLIDRYLVTAEQARIEPIICVNKVDLTDPAELQPLVGVYSRMGYEVLLVSATEGRGIERLRGALRDRQTAVAGQSGVGKSSLLNAVEPGLGLRVGEVSQENEKGKHTTTTAQLIPLSMGGYVVDTPGIRQFQLWDVIPQETAGLMRDVRPWVTKCRFPDCTHTHETSCAVKDAVADGRVDLRRYESYCQMFAGEAAG